MKQRLSELLAGTFRGFRRPSRVLERARPCLEALERRDVPSTFLDVAMGISGSMEYKQNFAAAAYPRYLGRIGSEAEVSSWVESLRQDSNERALFAGFVASTEFFQLHGGDATNWLQGLYNVVLGRIGSDAEIQSWLNSGVGQSPNPKVALDFINSNEAMTNFVTGLYGALLHRDPDSGGLAFWKGQLAKGASYASIIGAFVASPEYQALHGNTVGGFLVGAYQNILNRAPDLAGFVGWGTLLDPNFSGQFPTEADISSFLSNQAFINASNLTPDSLYLQSFLDQNLFAKALFGFNFSSDLASDLSFGFDEAGDLSLGFDFSDESDLDALIVALILSLGGSTSTSDNMTTNTLTFSQNNNPFYQPAGIATSNDSIAAIVQNVSNAQIATNSASNIAQFRGEIGFSFTVLNSDFSIAGQGTAHGPMSLVMTRFHSQSPWRLDSAQATLRQPSQVTANITGEKVLVDMTGSYSYLSTGTTPSSLQALNGSLQFDMQTIRGAGGEIESRSGDIYSFVIKGDFTPGLFQGSVINNPTGTNYSTSSLVKWNVGVPRVNGVQLSQQ